MSLASFVPWTTGPPAQTGVPVVNSLSLTFPWRSRTTVVLTRSQVQVVPSLALTVMDFPALTDWITPRSNASVLMPLRVCSVNWPSTPRSRKNAKTRRRARRQWAAPMPSRRASLGRPARCAAREPRRARAQEEPFVAGPAWALARRGARASGERGACRGERPRRRGVVKRLVEQGPLLRCGGGRAGRAGRRTAGGGRGRPASLIPAMRRRPRRAGRQPAGRPSSAAPCGDRSSAVPAGPVPGAR